MIGIDVSHHQPPKKVNYVQLKESGVEFVIARACYGTRLDATFLDHIFAARDAGLQVGGYSFFRQQQSPEAQLDMFRAQLMDAGLGSDSGSIIPTLDLEWNEHDGKVEPGKFDTGARLILGALREEFGDAFAYLAPGFYQTLNNPKWLLDFPWWIAHYTQGDPWCPWKDWTIHQHTGTGSLAGFDGPIDINRAKSLPLVSNLSPDITPGLRPEDMRDEDCE